MPHEDTDVGKKCDPQSKEFTCFFGPREIYNVGACKGGPHVCICPEGEKLRDEGEWGPCEGAVYETPEQCNGIDDDCDNEVDEDVAQSMCTVPDQRGVCAQGMTVCDTAARAMICMQVGQASVETCNGLNDDCDL